MNLNLRTVFKSISLSALTLLLSVTVLYATSTIGAAITTSSTLNADGAVTFGDTLAVTGVSTLTGNTILSTASSTGLVKVDSLRVAKTGTTNVTIAGLNFGYCTAPAVTVNASSTGMLSCASATGVVSGDRVFVQATSSLPKNFVVQHASTTADGVIQIDVYNEAWADGAHQGASLTTGINSFNFWAVR